MASKKQLFVSAALCGLFTASLGLAQGEAAAPAPKAKKVAKMKKRKGAKKEATKTM